MTFTRPWVLALLALPLLLAVHEWRQRGHVVALPFDHGRQGARAWLRRLLTAAQLLPAALAAVAIAILAGPTQRGVPAQERELTNIELCLDVSGSMGSELGDGTRYDAAMAAIRAFTEQREGDAFGLTIFGNEVLRWVPLTTDLSAIANATPFLRPELLPYHFQGTEIGKGLLFCRDRLLESEEGDRLIVLVSDGVSADLGGNRPQEISARLAGDGIVLYAVFIGSGTAPQQVYDVALPTGGEVFAVDDDTGLRRVFAHIDAMRPVRFKPAAGQVVDDFGLLAKIGLVVLAAYQLTLLGLRYTPW